jgi:hypothetical protein
MKFDKQLATFLYEHKYLPLEGIGEFTLDEKFMLPVESDKGFSFPTQGINFTYNKKTKVTPELTEYLKQKLSKPISLIISDLEDYTLEINNWLNIGKPCTIEGIGTLTKLQNGAVEFSIGYSKIENISSIIDSLSKKESDYSSFNPPKKSYDTRKIGIAIFGFILLAGLIAAIWAVVPIIKKRLAVKKEIVPLGEIKKTDTAIPVVKIDTPLVVKPINDTIRYKMIFLATLSKEKADKVYDAWIKFTAVNRDSATMNNALFHRLFIYKRALPIDTLKVKQQLELYFKHAITIEAAN